MKIKLSPTQEEAIAKLREHGKLIRYSGGFWSAPGVPFKYTYPGSPLEWEFGTSTIHALLKLGVLAVAEERMSRNGPYPVAVVLVEKGSN